MLGKRLWGGGAFKGRKCCARERSDLVWEGKVSVWVRGQWLGSGINKEWWGRIDCPEVVPAQAAAANNDKSKQRGHVVVEVEALSLRIAPRCFCTEHQCISSQPSQAPARSLNNGPATSNKQCQILLAPAASATDARYAGNEQLNVAMNLEGKHGREERRGATQADQSEGICMVKTASKAPAFLGYIFD